MHDSLLSFWQLEDDSAGVGDKALFERPLTAFFASRQCPGSAIRAAMDWTMEQARHKTPLIGGFQSPLERSVLEIALAAKSPVVIVLARGLTNAHLPLPWRNAVNDGYAAVVSIAAARKRLTEEVSQRRNQWVASHASRIVLAHINPSGVLAHQAEEWRGDGRVVEVLVPFHV
jgi:hypothetical protein